MTRFYCFVAVGVVCATICLASAAQAAFIVQPVDATASSTFGPRVPDRAISGVGLSDATIVETDDPLPGTFPTHDDDGGNTNWLANDTTPTIVFDLGEEYTLTGLHLWNHNATSEAGRIRGIRDVAISFSTTSAVAGFGGTQTFSQGMGNAFAISPGGNILGEDKSLSGLPEARWVRFVVSANHGATDFTGISEIRFFATPPVPEPATGGMILLGLFAFGLKRRRRK